MIDGFDQWCNHDKGFTQVLYPHYYYKICSNKQVCMDKTCKGLLFYYPNSNKRSNGYTMPRQRIPHQVIDGATKKKCTGCSLYKPLSKFTQRSGITRMPAVRSANVRELEPGFSQLEKSWQYWLLFLLTPFRPFCYSVWV